MDSSYAPISAGYAMYNIAKRKATLLSATPASPGQPAVLGFSGVWLELARWAQTIASPDPLNPALLGAARREEGDSRAIAALGPSALSADEVRYLVVCIWTPRRNEEASSAGLGGSGARMFERSEFACTPPRPSNAACP